MSQSKKPAYIIYPNTQHDDEQPILDVRHLSVLYDTHKALDNLTFHLHSGERVAVIGPNGAGKSTLFKVVAGVLPPTQGKVSVFGSQPAGHVCIGYVPQRSQVDWNFPVTVYDVVMMGRIAKMGLLGWPQARDHEQVRSALATVTLETLAKRQIGELSGGQQQRMFIARALAQEAELMLMDEPLAGLDVPSQEEILSLLNTLQGQRVTVMVATHDLDQAARHFDRVMLLNHKIHGFGTPEQVLQPQRLMTAYGGHLRLLGEDGLLAVDDSCCDDGEHIHVHLAD